MKVLMKGNEAIAEAALNAGCTRFFGYPITPQTELAAYMAKKMPKIDGAVFLQAESEVAAINMVIGASAVGHRVMTSSSSPGISLKSEGLSYLAGCDLPAVIVNVQRGGPGLGGIQPSQADYFQATRGGGHGDFHMVVVAPNSVQEMYDLTGRAFDIADKYRVTVMILADGILGQMMEPVQLTINNEQLTVEKPWAACGRNGRSHKNVISSLQLQAAELERQNLARFETYSLIAKNETLSEEYLTSDADVVVVAFGACSRIAKNAVDAARSEGIKAGLIRPISLWPFPKETLARVASTADRFVCVEMSMGQMIEDVELAIRCSKPVALCARTGGVVPTPDEILEFIRKGEK